MALREKATDHYYKINYDLCAVRDLKVFVNFSVYQSTAERDKEKEREGKWADFFQKLRQYLHTQYTELLTAIDTEGLNTDALLTDEDGKIDAENYPTLRVLQDRMNTLEPYEKAIGERLFCFGESVNSPLNIPSEDLSELSILGFEEEWITSPVMLDGGGEVLAGDYDGEPMTYEFFYERLKTVMGETEDC